MPSRWSQTSSQLFHYPPSLCHLEHWNTTCNYFESTYFVQRLTISGSVHSSVKVNVQRRILDRGTGISHSAPQHTQRGSTLHWKTRMLHVNWRNVKAKYEYQLGMQRTRMLDRILHHIHWTLNKNVACSVNNVAFKLWTLNFEWRMLNCEVEYCNVKTSNNSKQQCCKQKFEFWRGYNAIEDGDLTAWGVKADGWLGQRKYTNWPWHLEQLWLYAQPSQCPPLWNLKQ